MVSSSKCYYVDKNQKNEKNAIKISRKGTQANGLNKLTWENRMP